MKILTPLFQLICGILYCRPSFSLYTRNNYVYINRLCEMGKNKIGNRIPICVYCRGYGFTKCPYCVNGCFVCEYSTLSHCRFCFGNGKGTYAYVKINKK